MSWIQSLYDTYENCSSFVGIIKENEPILLPEGHMTQYAHIEVWLDKNGDIIPGLSKAIISKQEALTIIPCTEDSAGKANGRAPHPLFDKLQYLAGDYCEYGGDEKRHQFDEYITALKAWCESSYGNNTVKIILSYLEKCRLITDLIRERILYCDTKGKLLKAWNGDKSTETPGIFKTEAKTDQFSAFIRFNVDSKEAWLDRDVWQSHIDYQRSRGGEMDYCYATGNMSVLSKYSPKNIRRSGDGAKLISSNDNSNFTYRGRFTDAGQAARIGKETTDKAHAALRWLVSKQGKRITDTQAIISWRIYNGLTLDVSADTVDMNNEFACLLNDELNEPITGEDFADRLKKSVSGYIANLDGSETAAIMILDSATPGRMSINYYRELPEKELIKRIAKWHTECSWLQRYRFVQDGVDSKGKPKYKTVSFIGAPSPKIITEAAYGKDCSDKLKKFTIERIIPCIVDGTSFPRDIMLNVVRQASDPRGKEQWEINMLIGVACSLIRKCRADWNRNEHKEEWNMSLNTETKDRSYLFGRLLAWMEQAERSTYGPEDKTRLTNAQRLQPYYVQHPGKTAMNLWDKLQPYMNRLRQTKPNLYIRYFNGIQEIFNSLNEEAMLDPSSLNELYLLGYFSQTQEIFKKNKNNDDNTNGEEIIDEQAGQ
jgi:CRISPR-associated protein Csd1